MSHHGHRVLRKRNADLPLSGSVVESNPTPTASSLAQNTVAAANPGSTPVGIPLVDTSVSQSTPTSVTQSSTPTASANSSSGNQISLGTVIGACVAALIALVLAVLLAFYCSRRQKRFAAYSKSRNVAGNASRRRSHLEPWKRMDDNGDQRERPMRQRPPSTSLGAMFQRTISSTSGEKSSEGHNRESVGTMRHFAKYHPGLAAEMASQGTITGANEKVAKPPPALHLMGRSLDTAPPVSWDGETVGGESFISLHSNLSNPTSPFLMTTAKSTPPATSSSLHHWESAEVVHSPEDGELHNPFADGASSVRSSTRGRNPFFGAQDHPIRRTLLVDTHKNPFADDVSGDSSAAIRSLIAALQDPGSDRIVSLQSSVYSRMTGDDGDSAISVTAFPYPPTQVNVR